MATRTAQKEQEQVVVEDAMGGDTSRTAAPEQPVAEGLVLTQQPLLEESPAAVYLAHLAAGSRRTMRTALETMAGLLSGGRAGALTLAWGRVRYQHTAALRSLLAERYAPATANKMLAALRGVLKEAWRLEQMSAEEYRRAADLVPIAGSRPMRGRALEGREVGALFATCAADPTVAGARDAALLAVLYALGLRRSEVVALDLGDYTAQSEALVVRAGKGNKARVAYATGGAARALDAWLRVRGHEAGPLSWPVNKAGSPTMRRLSDQAVLTIMRKRAAQASVPAFSPHDLRRTFISDLLDAGADISTVQSLAGHAQVTTTQRYDRRGEATRRRAASLLRVPYAEGEQT